MTTLIDYLLARLAASDSSVTAEMRETLRTQLRAAWESNPVADIRFGPDGWVARMSDNAEVQLQNPTQRPSTVIPTFQVTGREWPRSKTF